MSDVQAVWDLSPLGWLLVLGVLVALGPLLWVWWRNRGQPAQRRLHALTVLTLFLTFDLVLFGAFTRLTDSGLGCPDWPGCYGNASPLGARAEISAAQAAMPTGPVTHSKAWIEMIHRYLASGVGFLILALAIAAWRDWLKQRQQNPAKRDVVHPWWPTVTLVWVCVQGAFGALTVTMKLFPAIVTLHLLGGLVLLALLCGQVVRRGLAMRSSEPVALPSMVRAGVWCTTALVVVQIVLGGWVSTNYAVLACTTFPQCQGSWWPVMDFAQGFQVWRKLGMLQDGSYISFAGLTAIHYTHRLMAYVVLAVMVWLAWRLYKTRLMTAQACWIAGLAALQLVTGLSNVVLGWPLLAAVLHTGGAAALVVVLTWVLAASRSQGAAVKVNNASGTPMGSSTGNNAGVAA